MSASVCRLLLTLIFTLVVICGQAINSPEQLPLSTTLTLRNATQSDAAAITTTILAAFHDAPHWKYGYQFMDKYPQEHFNCMYGAVYKVLDHPAALTQVVVSPNVTEPHEQTPIAVALWVRPDYFRSNMGDEVDFSLFRTASVAKCEHRDQNQTRVDDYEDQFRDAGMDYLNAVYARKNQLYLKHIGYTSGLSKTRGWLRPGKIGCQYRKKQPTREKTWTATLIATETGELLYSYLGWESMHNFTIRSLDVINGTRDEWRFDVMKYEL